MNKDRISFWLWFFGSSDRSPGWRLFVNKWLLFQVTVGALLAWLVPLTLEDAAKAVLLPLAGVLIGLTFAWAGNAQALLQTSEIEEFTTHHQGGFEEYTFVFQLAILTTLTTTTLWGVAALGVFDLPCGWNCGPFPYRIVSAALYTLAAITIRECWHVVLGAQWLLLARKRIRDIKDP